MSITTFVQEAPKTVSHIQDPLVAKENVNVVNKDRRSSLVSYIQRRFMSRGSNLRRFNVGSCPNIPQTVEKQDPKLHERLPLRTAHSTDPNKLQIPNLFITSQTHSKEWKIQSSSSPDLGNQPNRPMLRKAVSMTSPYETIRRDSRYFYRDSHISQVLDFLFIGDINCAYNPHILCRLEIKRIVDISDTRPQEVPANLKSLCSCPCRPDVKHSRPKLYVDVEKNDTRDIGLFFHEINRFIETARAVSDKVLVHSFDGSNRAPCVVIQYLMAHYNMDQRTAVRWVQKCRPCCNMDSNCTRALQAWEIRCVPILSSEDDAMEECIKRKMAWTDC